MLVTTGEKGTLHIPASGFPEAGYETSRFIAKIALEVLAYRCLLFQGRMMRLWTSQN